MTTKRTPHLYPGDRVLYLIPGEHPEDAIPARIVTLDARFTHFEPGIMLDTPYGDMFGVDPDHLTLKED